MKYFAYGMNTNAESMAMRCPDAISLGPAELPRHEFRFAHHADIVENPEFDTFGVLWEITEECLANLDILEGFPLYYDRKRVTVYHNGYPVEAITYYMVGDNPDSDPSEGYLLMLYEGYAEHGVSTEQIQEALDYIQSLNRTQGIKYYYD